MLLPPQLTQYWLDYSLSNRDPAYLQVTSEGNLLAWGGQIDFYCGSALQIDAFVGHYFTFLAHAFPMHNVNESMQWVELESGLILDVHCFFNETDGWILFVESSQEAQQVQSLMQQGNELKLLRQKYDKVVQRQLEREESSLVLESLLNLSPEQSPQTVSILQVRLNLDSSTQASATSQDALELLNTQLKDVFKVAIEEGGIIHHVFGQTVAVLFGLLPSPLDSAQQAIHAAHRLVKICKASLSSLSPCAEIAMGLGITTGLMDIDVRPVKNRRIFHIIGQTILRAEEMLLLIQPGLLLIDQPTFRTAELSCSRFSVWSPHESAPARHLSVYAQSLNE